jgi:hypothetical protein
MVTHTRKLLAFVLLILIGLTGCIICVGLTSFVVLMGPRIAQLALTNEGVGWARVANNRRWLPRPLSSKRYVARPRQNLNRRK